MALSAGFVGAHADERRVAESTVWGELHAADLGHLTDQV